MRRHAPHLTSLSSLLLLVASPVFAATPAPGSVSAEAAPAPAEVGSKTADTFVYGPILADDPEVRTDIKRLYREQRDLELALHEQLAELNAAVTAETDPDLRLQLQRDGMSLKESHLIQVTEIGLEIARLNGDEARAAEYEQALDHMRNPENYLPPTRDPAEVQRERARDAGLE